MQFLETSITIAMISSNYVNHQKYLLLLYQIFIIKSVWIIKCSWKSWILFSKRI